MRNALLKYGFYSICAVSALLIFNEYYSIKNFRGLDSDHAIHILMVKYFDLPKYLYYAGQDRLGSLIPIMAKVIKKIGSISNFNSVVWVQWLHVLMYFILAFPLSKDIYKKVLIPVIIILPASFSFGTIFIGHPYISHLLLTLAVLVLIKFSKRPIRDIVAGIILGVAVYVSEIAIANVLGYIVMLYVIRESNLKFLKETGFFLLGFSPFIFFIKYAKSHASWSDTRYDNIFQGDYHVIIEGLHLKVNSIFETLSFHHNEPYLKVVTLMVLTTLILLITYIIKNWKKLDKLSLFLILSTVLSFFAVVFSNWSSSFHYPSRYFIPSYVFLIWAAILVSSRLVSIAACITVLFSALTGIYMMNNFSMEVNDRVTRSEAETLLSRDEIYPVLGSYWNSYLIEGLSKDEEFCATAYEGAYIRLSESMDCVRNSDTITVIRNGFLSELPDTLKQYGRNYYRISEISGFNEFNYAHYTYRKK